MQVSEPRSSRAEKTREAILSAAENLFAEKGFAATRLEDVAEVVGIRRASIVYYFRDKPELPARRVWHKAQNTVDESAAPPAPHALPAFAGTSPERTNLVPFGASGPRE